MSVSIKYSDYGSFRCLFSLKATLRIIFELNCENTTVKKPETMKKVDFLFERANILSKKPSCKIGSKIKKKATFLDKP